MGGGLLGIGWIVDWFRTPSLVAEANQKILCKKDPTQTPPPPLRVSDAYLTWLPPFGFLGLHHVYLRNSNWGMLYAVTAGLCLIGWIVDAFYMVSAVNELNTKLCDPNEKVRKEAKIARQKAKG